MQIQTVKRDLPGVAILRAGALAVALFTGSFLAAALATPGAAMARDCTDGGCIADLERLPGGEHVDVGDVVRRARRFFGVNARAYLVSSESTRAFLPYYLRRDPPIVMRGQIHIPEIYYAGTELKNRGHKHYVWHYIIGHEMAHAYQDGLKLVEAMRGVYANRSVVMVELHADFLAGFFLSREFGLSSVAIDNLLRELRDLPSGGPDSPSYHGETGERFFMATQGALMAFQRPTPNLQEASARGVRCAFDLLAARDSTQSMSLSDLCK